MSTWNILVKENAQDKFTSKQSSSEYYLEFYLGQQSTLVRSNLWKLLEENKLSLSVTTSDFLDFAIAIYTVDQIISRRVYGFQRWSRHIKINYPVANLSSWDDIKSEMEKLLSYLSGDKWELIFRERFTPKVIQTHLHRNPNEISKVALFSGGLDSFISAIDLMENKDKVAFVSHYKNGTERPKQLELYKALEKKYGNHSLIYNQFYVQPNQRNPNARKEDTSRARSFLFLGLGITIANALGDDIPLIVPENGLISLNVPLTQTRLSSHSTRTTHPHYLGKLQKIIEGLGIKNKIHNPYQFKTKGEMMLECKNKEFLQQQYQSTLSCSHPDNSRFIKGSSPGIHCGYCVPCIIRQAAEHAAGSVKTNYVYQITTNAPSHRTKKGSDLRAFKMALEEIRDLPLHSKALRVLKSGPLPFNDKNELNQYIAVFERGMQEVRILLE